MKRRALITGITGQDGSYLAELLLEKDYEVHGTVRRVAAERQDDRLSRIRHLLPRLTLHAAQIESYPSVYRVVQKIQPHECYHLAAQSFVSYSFEDEFGTLQTNINGTHNVLASVRDIPGCRFYFAASSEMFGKVRETPQTERTPFHPRSTYGISKVAGFELTRNYREAYGLHASSGILFNHESPRRGMEFVTRKIAHHAAHGLPLTLGNIEARRDWGHARDYVRAMWLMLQQDEPDDYVIATGHTHSVREFCAEAYKAAGKPQEVSVSKSLFRPADVEVLIGDASKARARLKWVPKVGFRDLVREMVEAECAIHS